MTLRCILTGLLAVYSAACGSEPPEFIRTVTLDEAAGVTAARQDVIKEVGSVADAALTDSEGPVLLLPGQRLQKPGSVIHISVPGEDEAEEKVPPGPPPTEEELQKHFAALAGEMKKAHMGNLFYYFGKLGNPAARPFARDVLAFVRDKTDDDGWVGRDAALCLGKMGARELADDLMAALPEVKTETRYGIMLTLERFGDMRCIEVAKLLLPADEVLDFNGRSFGTSAHIQDAAIQLLVRYHPPGIEEEAAKMLTSNMPQTRLAGIRCLAELRATGRAADIAKLLGPDQPPGIRSHALLTLGEFHSVEFASQIVTVLLGENRSREQDGWPLLEQLRAHEHPKPEMEFPALPVSVAAFTALAGMGARDFAPQLGQALKKVPEPWLTHVLKILADHQAREAGPQIAALLARDLRDYRREAVIKTLQEIQARDQAPQLAQLLLPADKGGLQYGTEEERERTGVMVIDALKELSPAVLRGIIPGVLQSSGIPKTRARVLVALHDMDAVPFIEIVRKLAADTAEPAELRMEAACLLWEMRLMPTMEALAFTARCVARGMPREELLDEKAHPWSLYITKGPVSALLSDADDEVVRGALLLLDYAETKAPPHALAALLVPARSHKVKESALAAMTMTLNEEQLAAVTRAAGDDPALAEPACQVLLRADGVSQTVSLVPYLSHQHRGLHKAAWRTLIQLGGALPAELLPDIMESSHLQPDRRGQALFAAYFFFTRDAAFRAAIPFLGERDRDEYPALPKDREKAREALMALNAFCSLANAQRHELALNAAGTVMARIAEEAAWDYRDADFLQDIAVRLSAKQPAAKKAAAVQAVARAMQAQHPLRRTGRVLLWVIVLQPLLWLLVLILYPWARPAQWMVWTPWTRRWLGFGWVGPIAVRWLRERLWRPFRDALVPPGEVVSFDEWTFFDSVRVASVSGAGESQSALRVLSDLRGVAMLRGESGLGKTTLLQALAAQAQRPVALLRAAECGAGLLAALEARLPRFARKDTAFVRALVRRGSPDIFVDAVHEALPEARAKLTEEVNALRGANIVLTSQPVADWKAPQGAAEWQLQPLRAQDVAPFLLKQGTAAVEAARTGSLAERQRAFAARTAQFLQHFENLPPESTAALAIRSMLGNPMEAVLAAELLAAGQTPEPNRLLEQRMEHFAEDYHAECGDRFPAAAFAEHLRAWRASGAPLLRLDLFATAASFLARHRLLRKSADGVEAWRFRHDKFMEWFLRPGTS